LKIDGFVKNLILLNIVRKMTFYELIKIDWTKYAPADILSAI